jgi:hypothetical protein
MPDLVELLSTLSVFSIVQKYRQYSIGRRETGAYNRQECIRRLPDFG